MKQEPISCRADNALAARCQSFAARWACVLKRPIFYLAAYIDNNHKNYNFLDFDWFKKLLFFTNSLAKLLSDSLLLDSLLSDSSISQSYSKL